MNDKYIREFYNEVCNNLEGDYKIVLEPGRGINEEWVEYDPVKWEMEEGLQRLTDSLVKDEKLSFEEKLLAIYKYICLNYIYDDNVLFFFRKDTSDINNIKYIAVDWYARIVDKKWKENRMHHNRRVCYEFARFYAKAINKLLKDNDDLEACIVGDRENTHYFVGLTGKDYSIVLDLDDFNSIKDLTRLKLNLTLKGIKIFRDDSGKIQNAIDEFNKDKMTELPEIEEAQITLKNEDLIKYFNKVAEILKRHEIDSQGFMEYMRVIVEAEEIETEKIWRKIEEVGKEKRHVRCLIFYFNSKTYLIDSVEKSLREITNKEDLDENVYILKPEEHEYAYFGG